MTREEAKELLALMPVIEAYAAGKAVQVHSSYGWGDAPDPKFSTLFNWRIKPEPKLRPWKPSEVPIGGVVRNRYDSNTKRLICYAGEANWGGVGFSCDYAPASLAYYEYSTDGGKTFLPCGIEEAS